MATVPRRMSVLLWGYTEGSFFTLFLPGHSYTCLKEVNIPSAGWKGPWGWVSGRTPGLTHSSHLRALEAHGNLQVARAVILGSVAPEGEEHVVWLHPTGKSL